MAWEGFLNFLQEPRDTLNRIRAFWARSGDTAYTPFNCSLAPSNIRSSGPAERIDDISRPGHPRLASPRDVAIITSARRGETSSRVLKSYTAGQPGPEVTENQSPRLPLQRSSTLDDLMDGGDEIAIDEDVWGATLYVICFDLTEVLGQVDHDGLSVRLNVYRLSLVLFLLVCNYVLQLGFLYWIYNFVALPAVHKAQVLYKDYHKQVYIEGQKSFEAWMEYTRKDELCSIAFSNFFFMYAILSLWWLLMVDEIRKNERLYRKIHQIHLTEDANHMIHKHNDVNVIVRLTMTVRTALDVLLIMPKVVIVFILTIVGTVWLAATGSFSELILNAIALEFVITIDEVLFNAVLPESMKDEIAHAKMIRPRPALSGDAEEDAKTREATLVRGYQRSTIALFGTLILVFLYMTFGQHVPIIGVFPGYAHDISCPLWQAERTEALCHFMEECFPTFD